MLFFAFFASGHVLLRKRDVRAAIGWIGLIWLVPFVGVVLYLLLGINRIKRRAVALGIREPRPLLLTPAQDEVRRDESKLSSPSALALRAYMDRVVPRPLLGGNGVRVLDDGDGAYPAMIAAIDDAKHSVGLSTYIFDSREAGRAFIDALVRAHSRGVAVRVLIDAVGSRYSMPSADRFLARASVPCARFLPVLFSPWFNLRNHRKILVVDGTIGFTGGLNIREEHVRARAKDRATLDTHFELRGPVVAQLTEIFAQDWAFTTRELLTGPGWFPEEIARGGGVLARAIGDGPDADFEALKWTLLGAVSCASRSVRIMTPYFLPDPDLATALNVAAMRGVDVRIVVPERGNLPVVQWAMWAEFRKVLGNGCRVHLVQPPFDHSKLMVVDDVWTLFGSGNWDPRSLRINFEIVVEAYDAELAGSVGRRLESRIAAAREITLDDLDTRPIVLRLRDGAARLFSPYL
ncbi:MAG: PLDc N-terminal domain-containing protein [Polyangiaceae bacterium]|nr:PLDc N-terminal domain-containing protein [Polyangiaceae bacterium]